METTHENVPFLTSSLVAFLSTKFLLLFSNWSDNVLQVLKIFWHYSKSYILAETKRQALSLSLSHTHTLSLSLSLSISLYKLSLKHIRISPLERQVNSYFQSVMFTCSLTIEVVFQTILKWLWPTLKFVNWQLYQKLQQY